MPYNASALRLLISSPSDVPFDDLRLIQRVISRCNVSYGAMFSSVVVPVSWGEHAAAEFGRPAQQILNDRLVDYCDLCIAIFANRLGTATSVAESGTAEEIERLHEAGRYVAVLRCRRPVDTSTVNADQLVRLDTYMSGLRDNGIVLDYSTDGELESAINNILASAVASDHARAQLQLQQSEIPETAAQALAEVWPRIESSEEVRTDSKGRIKTSRRWYLVLSNSGTAPARDVRFSTAATSGGEQPWMIIREREDQDGDSPDVATLAPRGGEARFAVVASMGSAIQVECEVSWEDDGGRRSNATTLRLV